MRPLWRSALGNGGRRRELHLRHHKHRHWQRHPCLADSLSRGVDGAHPEIGHQVLDNSGPQCYCGARGCWESLASGPAMVSWMRDKNPDAQVTTASDICDSARRGDPLALRGVEREGYYLGLGLANLITLFAPDKIVLGGGVMKSSSLFLDTARRVIRKIWQVPSEKTHIALASLGPDIGLFGAAQAWLLKISPMSLDSHGCAGGMSPLILRILGSLRTSSLEQAYYPVCCDCKWVAGQLTKQVLKARWETRTKGRKSTITI